MFLKVVIERFGGSDGLFELSLPFLMGECYFVMALEGTVGFPFGLWLAVTCISLIELKLGSFVVG